jgi:patatin-like phospholipase/acyl hydrolase
MAMKDIFDMTAGTSTGSIIASALAFPNATVTSAVADMTAAD